MRVTDVTLRRNGGKPPLRALAYARATKENPWMAGPFLGVSPQAKAPPSTRNQPSVRVTPITRLTALGVTTGGQA